MNKIVASNGFRSVVERSATKSLSLHLKFARSSGRIFGKGTGTASFRLNSSWTSTMNSHKSSCNSESSERSQQARQKPRQYHLSPPHRQIKTPRHGRHANSYGYRRGVCNNNSYDNGGFYFSIRWFGDGPASTEKDYTRKQNGISNNNEIPTTAKMEPTSKVKDNHGSATSDPPVLTWVDEYLPEHAKPYARLARIDKPIGTWLLLWPCFWSTALASASQGSLAPDPFLLGLFGTGAIVMRGAGCTINDLWDSDIDAKVARTKTRPIASGDVTVSQAIGFLAAQLSIGLGVLVSLPHTWYCFQWGAASLPLVALYPLTKRFLPWPQLFLGVTMNWGAWMGWAATYGSMDYSILPFLYGSGVTWTLVYDTIYAHQDKEEDASLGLNSTALAFGQEDARQKKVLHGLAALTWIQWMAVGYSASDFLAFPYYQVGVTAAYAHLVWQIHTADFNNPHNVMARFRSNSAVGAVVFGSIAVGGILQ